MRVQMITIAAGPHGVWPAGSVQTVDDESGAMLSAGGYAVAVDGVEVIEVAIVDPVEEVADAPAQAAPKPRRGRPRKASK